jgi:hypothetical protein
MYAFSARAISMSPASMAGPTHRQPAVFTCLSSGTDLGSAAFFSHPEIRSAERPPVQTRTVNPKSGRNAARLASPESVEVIDSHPETVFSGLAL